MQLAAYLRTHGKYDVRIMDNAFWKGNDDGIRGTVDKEVQPDIIGIGGMTMQLHDTIRLASVIRRMHENDPQIRNGKKKRPLLVAGGVHFTFCPQDAYELFDLVVIGEGEETFLNVCDRFKASGSYTGKDYADILGIGYKTEPGKPFTLTAPRPLLAADKICAPAFDLVPWLTRYDDGFITGHKAPMLMTGRGCPYDCEFCAAPQIYQRKVRLFPMDMVKEIMTEHKKIFGSNQCRVMDDTFAASPKRVSEFCDMVNTNFGPNRMSCLTHCHTADLDSMKLMKQTGFDIVAYGVESGNDEVLRLINKKITAEQAAKAIQTARQAGLDVEALFMIGCIGETEQSINDTIKFAVKHNNPSQYNRNAAWNWFQFATPFPGSRFFNEYPKYGKLTSTNYNDYHHQTPVFIPNGLTAEKMVQLRDQAFKEAR
jgi:radical SAM superfamily enzyme YgiQ (UPF0313 family)